MAQTYQPKWNLTGVTPTRYGDTEMLMDWAGINKIQPTTNPEADRATRYNVTGNGQGAENLFDLMKITKNPALQSMVEGQGGFADSLRKMMASLNTSQPTRTASYLGGLNTAASRYGEDTSGMVDRYGNVISGYETAGKGALDAELENARDIQTQLQKAQNLAVNRVLGRANLQSMASYAGGGPRGLSSAETAGLVTRASNAALPYSIQGNQIVGNVLSRYLPFYGDVSGRRQGQITGLELPLAESVYGKDIYNLNQADATTQRAMAEKEAQLALLAKYGQLSPLYEYTSLNYKPGATALQPNYNQYWS